MGKRMRAPCILHKPTGTQPQTFSYFLPHKPLLGDNSKGTGKKCERIHNACRQIIPEMSLWDIQMALRLPSLWIQMHVTDVALCSEDDGDEQFQTHHTSRHSKTDFLMPLCCLPHECAALTNLSGMATPGLSGFQIPWRSHLSSGTAREVQPLAGKKTLSSHLEGFWGNVLAAPAALSRWKDTESHQCHHVKPGISNTIFSCLECIVC